MSGSQGNPTEEKSTNPPQGSLQSAALDMWKILDELEDAFDKEIFPEQVKEDFDALPEREYTVTITAKQWRAIGRALEKVERHRREVERKAASRNAPSFSPNFDERNGIRD